ncbi:phospholipase A and acyltransferase 1-like [Acipenser ruthenus]|uniref:phospholipase A and acyltransferase 1-like n=1 Tax=Acipenser ruthenus TaxID=7906 RepID=UPI00145BF762|nr:phospholipase A and acyltransferase 1-like [Acipenser ruthenus]
MAGMQVRVEGYLDACPGELLEFDFGPLSHWGVYVGEGEVIHFSWPEDTEAWIRHSAPSIILFSETMVRKERVADIAGISAVYTNRSYDLVLPPLPGTEILRRGQVFMDRTLPYNSLTFNCEHFATFLRYGKAQSRQVSRFDLLHLTSHDPTREFKKAYRQALKDQHAKGILISVLEDQPRQGCNI